MVILERNEMTHLLSNKLLFIELLSGVVAILIL